MRIENGVIYETQVERTARIAFQNEQFRAGKKRSRQDARLRSTRIRILRRAKRLCEICGFDFFVVLNIHHILPVQLGGSADDSNLIALCPNCHALAHHFSFGKNPEGNIRALVDVGLSEDQAKRLLLVANTQAEVTHDGQIIDRRDIPRPTYILDPSENGEHSQ